MFIPDSIKSPTFNPFSTYTPPNFDGISPAIAIPKNKKIY